VAAEPLGFSDPLPPGAHQTSGRVMGSDLHVVTVGGPPGLPGWARTRLSELEDRWSRFRPASELSRVSAGVGQPVGVSLETFRLIAAMRTAWVRTGGRCDASVLPAIDAAGYDRDLASLPRDRAATSLRPRPTVLPGLGDVDLDEAALSVRLPVEVQLDPGAIGKGFAGDLVAGELLEAGADGALVNVGGDLVVVGEPVDGDAWTVELQLASGPPVLVTLADGAVATSSSRRRRWQVDGRDRHHLIDPSTCEPVPHPPASVSAITGEGWWAEAAATAIAVGSAGWAQTWAPANAVTGLVEDINGERHLLPGAGRFLS